MRSLRMMVCVLAWTLAAAAQDMPLHDVLEADKDWELIAEGYQFTDGPCADADGNFYFTDVAKGTAVFKVGADNKVTEFIQDAPKVSGLKWGPDGRLYACQGGLKRLVAFDTAGKQTVIAENVQPNDLVVTHKGHIYFTDTGKKEVVLIDAKGEKRVVDTGINKPNGLTLSPDQGTLIVSDFGGPNLWAFRVEADGSLSAKQAYMHPRLPRDKVESLGDGMTTDNKGRFYCCTAVGLQVFDPTGRLSGVILKPQDKFLSNVAFAGPEHKYLYVTCQDRIYRRKTQAQGVLFFKGPLLALPK